MEHRLDHNILVKLIMPQAAHSSTTRTQRWMPSRRARHCLGWSLAHYCALVLLENFLFLLSHIPLVPLDTVIFALSDLAGFMRLPGRLLRLAWPWESTPTPLLWGVALLNSLIWGGVLMGARTIWKGRVDRSA